MKFSLSRRYLLRRERCFSALVGGMSVPRQQGESDRVLLDHSLRNVSRPSIALITLAGLENESKVVDIALLRDVRDVFSSLQRELADAKQFAVVVAESPPLKIAELERLRLSVARARSEIGDFVLRRQRGGPIDYSSWDAVKLANSLAANVEAQMADLVVTLTDEQRAPIEQQLQLERTAELRRLAADALAVEATLREAVASITALAKKTVDSEKDIDQWRRRIEEAKIVVTQLQSPIEDLTLRDPGTGADRPVTLAEFLASYGALQAQLSVRAGELQRMVAEWRRLTTSANKISSEFSAATNELAKYDDRTVERLQEQAVLTRQKIDALAATAAATAARTAELESIVAKSDKQAREIDLASKRVSEALVRYDAKWLTEKKTELDTDAKQLRELSSAIAKLDWQTSAYVAEVKDARATLVRAQAPLERLRTQISQARDEVQTETRKLRAELIETDEYDKASVRYRSDLNKARRAAPILPEIDVVRQVAEAYRVDLTRWSGEDLSLPFAFVAARLNLAQLSKNVPPAFPDLGRKRRPPPSTTSNVVVEQQPVATSTASNVVADQPQFPEAEEEGDEEGEKVTQTRGVRLPGTDQTRIRVVPATPPKK